MAENSNIEWTDHTFNPWIGCQKVSPGCDHCYAETWDARGLQQRESRWGPHAARTRTSVANWRKPLAWDKAAKEAGKRSRVFCASLADVFDNHASITQEWRDDLWTLIYRTPHLDWLLLTKRPQNIAKFMPPAVENGGIWPNVWIGITVENQTEADRRIPHLLATPAAVRFLSCEPLLGPVDTRRWLKGCWECAEECGWRSAESAGPTNERCHVCGWSGSDAEDFCPECSAQDFGGVCDECGANTVQFHPDTHCLDWVICGGESGPGARPMHPDWARSLRDQCVAAGVPFFFKQWGEWGPSTPEEAKGNPRSGWQCLASHPHIAKAAELYPEAGAAFIEHKGKKAAGRLLDGRAWDQMPGVDNA